MSAVAAPSEDIPFSWRDRPLESCFGFGFGFAGARPGDALQASPVFAEIWRSMRPTVGPCAEPHYYIPTVEVLFIVAVVLVIWIAIRIQPLIGHAHIERLERFHSSLAADREKVVICLGDSLTQGNVSFDYVHALASRVEPWGYTVLNAGINGELAWNLLQRVDQVVSSDPAYVVLLVGTNDARGSENAKAANRYLKDMKLPQAPDEDFFVESYRQLLDALKNSVSARVIVVTLPPMGEKSGEAIDGVVDRFNAFIEEEARKRGLASIPYGRSLRENLLSDSFEDSPPYSASSSNRLIFKALLRRYLQGWRWDRIAENHRMKFLTDMIHLNERAGAALVDLIEAEVRSEEG